MTSNLLQLHLWTQALDIYTNDWLSGCCSHYYQVLKMSSFYFLNLLGEVIRR
jgi:hypothetical protein